MNIDVQTILNVLGGLLTAVLGWWMNTMYQAHQALRQQVSDLSVKLPTDYVAKSDFQSMRHEMAERFDRIEQKLDRIAK